MRYILEHEGKMYRKYFEDICSIPHVSYNEKAISDYVVRFAEERKLWYKQDEVWNVIIKKPASSGYENHAPVMIQGHLDMVGVKAPDSNHDFAKDPIPLYVEDGFIRSHGTTLGADCGHGISYMLSILDDKTLKHPPIEALFTVQEEVGIGGPQYLDYSLLNAKRLIFTDSMEEGRPELSTTSVVGGDLIKDVSFDVDKNPTYKICVTGLKGGHAAVNINEGRGNAIHLISRVLLHLFDKGDIRIVNFTGGDLKNNIPKESEAIFTSKMDRGKIEENVAEMADILKFEFREHDPNISITMEKVEENKPSLSVEVSKEIVDWIVLIPTGTYATSFSDPSFPWTSRNLGTIKIAQETVIIGYQYRSSMESHIKVLMQQMDIINRLYGVKWNKTFGYAGYVTPPGTPMYNAYDAVYRELTGKGLKDKHIHAGTDVGTIIEGMGGDIDVVGIGPNTYNFHTPFEEMELESYDRAYQCIIKVLEKL